MKKIAVFFGGKSNEKEISLESGRNVVYKLSPEYEVTPVFVNKELNLYKINNRLLVQNSTKEIESSLEFALEKNEAELLIWDDLSSKFDFVFLSLHGGEGENGTFQGALEMLKIPYNGSGVFTSSLCSNKFNTSKFLKERGFDVLENRLIEKKDWKSNKDILVYEIESQFNFPVITKPSDDGCSVMVYKSDNTFELIKHIEETLEKKDAVMIEKFAKDMIELTVGCIGNEFPQALVPTQTVSTKNVLSMEEKFLPGAGLNITPANISEEDIKIVQTKIEEIYTALDCSGYSRIDCFYDLDSKKLYPIDINTLPALTPATCIFHQAAEMEMSPYDFLKKIIELGFEKHTKTVYQEQKEVKEQKNKPLQL